MRAVEAVKEVSMSRTPLCAVAFLMFAACGLVSGQITGGSIVGIVTTRRGWCLPMLKWKQGTLKPM